MTITISIKPEVQTELARQAAAHGCALEYYAAKLLENAIISSGETLIGGRQPVLDARNLVDVCAMVRGLTDDVDFSRDPSLGRPVDLT